MGLIDEVDSSGSPVYTSPYSFDLPAGNVAFIERSGEISFNLETTFKDLNEFTSSGAPRWKSNSMIGNRDSLPTSGDSFGTFGGVENWRAIPWSIRGNVDAYGKTRNAGYAMTLRDSYRYLVIFNPLYSQNPTGTASDSQYINPTIHVTVTNFNSVRIYPLRLTYNEGSRNFTSVSDGGYQDYLTAQPDENTGIVTWVDPSGSYSDPVVGGSTYVSSGDGETGFSFPGGSLLEKISAFLGYLESLVNDKLGAILEMISGFFNSIPVLFNGFSMFLRDIFGFLPEEAVMLILFGLAAVVFIGIIKAIRR